MEVKQVLWCSVSGTLWSDMSVCGGTDGLCPSGVLSVSGVQPLWLSKTKPSELRLSCLWKLPLYKRSFQTKAKHRAPGEAQVCPQASDFPSALLKNSEASFYVFSSSYLFCAKAPLSFHRFFMFTFSGCSFCFNLKLTPFSLNIIIEGHGGLLPALNLYFKKKKKKKETPLCHIVDILFYFYFSSTLQFYAFQVPNKIWLLTHPWELIYRLLCVCVCVRQRETLNSPH